MTVDVSAAPVWRTLRTDGGGGRQQVAPRRVWYASMTGRADSGFKHRYEKKMKYSVLALALVVAGTAALPEVAFCAIQISRRLNAFFVGTKGRPQFVLTYASVCIAMHDPFLLRVSNNVIIGPLRMVYLGMIASERFDFKRCSSTGHASLVHSAVSARPAAGPVRALPTEPPLRALGFCFRHV